MRGGEEQMDTQPLAPRKPTVPPSPKVGDRKRCGDVGLLRPVHGAVELHQLRDIHLWQHCRTL